MNHDQVVSNLVAGLESAWNAADGAGYARACADDADFVNIRGDHFRSREAIAKRHQAIFDTIYKGSRVRYEVSAVRTIAPTVLLAHVKAVLNAPTGPLAGEQWRAAAFYNTLVAQN